MLLEKNTLFGLLVLWFTGWSAVSIGHWPFCASASTSVPGAPASSLVTGSQLEALKPGVEICAPVAVVLALLSTLQPPVPRLAMSLAPVSEGDAIGAAGATARPGRADDAGDAWAAEVVRKAAANGATAHNRKLRRMA